MTSNAMLVHTLAEKLNRKPAAEDPFFARGLLATELHKQAIALSYFGSTNYEDAVRRIHNDFSLKGTPYESRVATMVDMAMCRLLAKHYEDTCQGRRKVEIGTTWTLEETKGIWLRSHSTLVEFDCVNLLTGKVHYRHELEDVNRSFQHFLTHEDHASFKKLADEVLVRHNR